LALLEIKNLDVRYIMKERQVLACDDVSLSVEEGDSIGIVGESGSGKSTMAMCVLGLLPKDTTRTSGEILFQGEDLVKLTEQGFAKLRWKSLSAVFQKSMNSLSPVHKVCKQMFDIYRVHTPGADENACKAMAGALLDKVNLPQSVLNLYPHQLSGGMIQRISIALCLMFDPALIILDEATTALDVVTESQILRELTKLREASGITCMMITHNMAVVAGSCDKVAVMYAGRLVETGMTARVLTEPRHPYTQGLLASFPTFEGKKQALKGIPGSLPDLSGEIPGCVFAYRCPHAAERCFNEKPVMTEHEPGWKSACWLGPR
jgi:peptide/nickel transport system ATP-binding protein